MKTPIYYVGNPKERKVFRIHPEFLRRLRRFRSFLVGYNDFKGILKKWLKTKGDPWSSYLVFTGETEEAASLAAAQEGFQFPIDIQEYREHPRPVLTFEPIHNGSFQTVCGIIGDLGAVEFVWELRFAPPANASLDVIQNPGLWSPVSSRPELRQYSFNKGLKDATKVEVKRYFDGQKLWRVIDEERGKDAMNTMLVNGDQGLFQFLQFYYGAVFASDEQDTFADESVH